MVYTLAFIISETFPIFFLLLFRAYSVAKLKIAIILLVLTRPTNNILVVIIVLSK